ncbi:histone-lysine N-methyltransferase 2B-like [Scomber scombrus]|uniref:Histone-lysine N-methyltransferase 2B-like n=1 Tax=Scomber scombrus TaxID=13677 RepID=A0AAV1QBX6_SCOSC
MPCDMLLPLTVKFDIFRKPPAKPYPDKPPILFSSAAEHSKSNLSQSCQVDEERSGTPQSLSGSEDRSSTPGITAQQPSTSTSAPSTSKGRPSRSRSPRDRISTPAVPAQAPRETRRAQRHDTDIGERLMSLLEQPLPKPHMPDGELDEAYHFALSLVPMVNRLNRDRRQQAKVEILSVLHNLERGQAQQATVRQELASWHQPPNHPPLPPPTLGQSSHTQFQPPRPPRTLLPPPSHFLHINPPPQTGSYPQMLEPEWEDPKAGGPYYANL